MHSLKFISLHREASRPISHIRGREVQRGQERGRRRGRKGERDTGRGEKQK